MSLSTIFGIISAILIVIVFLICITSIVKELVKDKMYGALVILLLSILAGVFSILSLVFY